MVVKTIFSQATKPKLEMSFLILYWLVQTSLKLTLRQLQVEVLQVQVQPVNKMAKGSRSGPWISSGSALFLHYRSQ